MVRVTVLNHIGALYPARLSAIFNIDSCSDALYI